MSTPRLVKSFSIASEAWDAISEEANRRGVSKSHIVNEALGDRLRTKIERDEWETMDASRSYDPKHFYTASENKKGFSSTVKFAIPKGLVGQIQRLVNSGLIPEYRSNSDFFRDAAMHRLKQVAAWIDDGELETEVDLMLMIFEQDKIHQQKNDVDLLLSLFRTNLEDAMARGDWNFIRDQLEEMSHRVESIPAQHQSKYLNLLADYKDKLERNAPLRNEVAERRAQKQA